MANILTQKYFSTLHVYSVCSQNDRFQYTVKRSNLFCSEHSPPATSVGQCAPQQGLGWGQGRGHSRNRGAPVRGCGICARCSNEIRATVIDHSMREAGQRVHPNLSRHTVASIVCTFGNDNDTSLAFTVNLLYCVSLYLHSWQQQTFLHFCKVCWHNTL